MKELNDQQKVELADTIFKTTKGFEDWDKKDCLNLSTIVLSKIKELESFETPTYHDKNGKLLVVHERVTRFKQEELGLGSCIDTCKFFPAIKIGSVLCDRCEHNKGSNDSQQWVICKLYNKEENE